MHPDPIPCGSATLPRPQQSYPNSRKFFGTRLGEGIFGSNVVRNLTIGARLELLVGGPVLVEGVRALVQVEGGPVVGEPDVLELDLLAVCFEPLVAS